LWGPEDGVKRPLVAPAVLRRSSDRLTFADR
jgi:hypothetical protein